MDVKIKRPCKAYPAARILTGKSSWDGTEDSVKFGYLDSRGRTARSGPEVGGPILLELLEAALADGVVSHKDVAEILYRTL